jgi:hypothetical protein
MDLTKMSYDYAYMELAQDGFQWRTLELAVLNHRVQLPKHYLDLERRLWNVGFLFLSYFSYFEKIKGGL